MCFCTFTDFVYCSIHVNYLMTLIPTCKNLFECMNVTEVTFMRCEIFHFSFLVDKTSSEYGSPDQKYFKEKAVTLNNTTVNKGQYTAKYIILSSPCLSLHFLVSNALSILTDYLKLKKCLMATHD